MKLTIQCRFCDAELGVFANRCTWRAVLPVDVPIPEASVGDIWITERNRRRGKIVEIVLLDSNHLRVTNESKATRWQLWVKLPGSEHPVPYAYIRYREDNFVSERMRECGAAACDMHMRDLDGGFICQEHWPAQLEAIVAA